MSSRRVPRSAPAIPAPPSKRPRRHSRWQRQSVTTRDSGCVTGPKAGLGYGEETCSGALSKLDSAIEEATASHDTMLLLYALLVQGFARAAWATATVRTHPPMRHYRPRPT